MQRPFSTGVPHHTSLTSCQGAASSDTGSCLLQVAGVTLVAAFLLRMAVVSYWELRVELMKSKFKMRLAAERAKGKDISALQVAWSHCPPP